ncbi:peroxisomal membrane anchor protein conserved region-domain-containing protein [Lipomyces arxii]|uniref:peroxisomal membrane anchor protein conserved region-domain-containing protein n=1 Tax=Lipomyces arxii TaxID=56418 RepID=UPI0034CD12A7
MALREDFISSAVTFLLDPKAAESPLTQRIQFLESKGLNEQEIFESLRRVKSPQVQIGQSTQNVQNAQPQNIQTTGYIPPRPAYYPPQRQQQQGQTWKDLFVMATASSGVTYGVYILAKRYILPLVLPPTPPALEADKQAIAAEFDRAEQLLQQIQAETLALSEAEQKRVEAVDSAVEELHKVIDDAKKQLDEREREMRQLQSEIETVRTELPKFLGRATDGHKHDLLDIQTEIKSLKQILSNRIKSEPGPPAQAEPKPVSTRVPFTPTSSLRPPVRAGIPDWQRTAAESAEAAEASSASSTPPPDANATAA